MSSRAEAGKRAWQQRGPAYADELRAAVEERVGGARIDREAAKRFARWQARGRLPLWLRVKCRVRALLIRSRAAS